MVSRSAGAGRAKTKGRSASKSTLVYKSLSSCRMKTILSSRKRNAKAWGRGRCAVHWLSLFGQYRVESRTAIPAPNRAPGVILRWSGVSRARKERLFSMASRPFRRDWHGAVVKFVTGDSSRINSVQQPRNRNLLNLREIKCIPKR